jgi:hypothetical protein
MPARKSARGALVIPVAKSLALDKSSESCALRKSDALQKTLVRLTAQIHPIVEGDRRKQFHAVTLHAARRTATVLRCGSDH